MANINITYRCNLRCPYCFANEFVNKFDSDMTLENFSKIVKFVTSSGPTRVGIIGGEPLLHPLFSEFIKQLVDDDKIKGINVYTYGIYLDKYFDLLSHPKIDLLVNCNSPQKIGTILFKKLQANLDVIFRHKGESISLGVNIYDDCNDYSFMVNLLQTYNQRGVRLSMTVPNLDVTCEDSIKYFIANKKKLWDFFMQLRDIGTIPYYDCNAVPFCVWNNDEQIILEEWCNSNKDVYTNITNRWSSCQPIIDILPNMYAIRCFGLSEYTKVSINEFDNIDSLYQFYITNIDSLATKTCSSKNCIDCQEYLNKKCMFGCIRFNTNVISNIRGSRNA